MIQTYELIVLELRIPKRSHKAKIKVLSGTFRSI